MFDDGQLQNFNPNAAQVVADGQWGIDVGALGVVFAIEQMLRSNRVCSFEIHNGYLFGFGCLGDTFTQPTLDGL